MKKICLKKTKHTIKSVSYSKPCPACFCIYCTSVESNLCNHCKKATMFTSNHFIFTFALHNLLQNFIYKKDTKISFSEVRKIEDSIMEIIDDCLHIDYCMQNLTLYIKIPTNETALVITEVLPIIKKIIHLIATKITTLSDYILQQIIKELKIKLIETCENFENLETIKNISNINVLKETQKNACTYTSRKILQKKFNEYFDFFNDC